MRKKNKLISFISTEDKMKAHPFWVDRILTNDEWEQLR